VHCHSFRPIWYSFILYSILVWYFDSAFHTLPFDDCTWVLFCHTHSHFISFCSTCWLFWLPTHSVLWWACLVWSGSHSGGDSGFCDSLPFLDPIFWDTSGAIQDWAPRLSTTVLLEGGYMGEHCLYTFLHSLDTQVHCTRARVFCSFYMEENLSLPGGCYWSTLYEFLLVHSGRLPGGSAHCTRTQEGTGCPLDALRWLSPVACPAVLIVTFHSFDYLIVILMPFYLSMGLTDIGLMTACIDLMVGRLCDGAWQCSLRLSCWEIHLLWRLSLWPSIHWVFRLSLPHCTFVPHPPLLGILIHSDTIEHLDICSSSVLPVISGTSTIPFSIHSPAIWFLGGTGGGVPLPPGRAACFGRLGRRSWRTPTTTPHTRAAKRSTTYYGISYRFTDFRCSHFIDFSAVLILTTMVVIHPIYLTRFLDLWCVCTEFSSHCRLRLLTVPHRTSLHWRCHSHSLFYPGPHTIHSFRTLMGRPIDSLFQIDSALRFSIHLTCHCHSFH